MQARLTAGREAALTGAITLKSGLLQLPAMKFRNIVLVVAPLAIMVALFLWFEFGDTPVKSDSNQETVSRDESIVAAPIISVPPTPKPEEASENSISNTAGNAISFARVSMSELEEVNLANAGDEHSHKIREWRGRIEPSLSALQELLASEGEDGVLAISLPDASQIQVTRMRYEGFGAKQGVFTGKILGDTFGEVVLSYVNQAVAGSIHDYRNDAVWEIRNAGEGRQYIAQVDVNALGECGVCKEHAER